jgi:hypothetical protein
MVERKQELLALSSLFVLAAESRDLAEDKFLDGRSKWMTSS